MRRRLAAALVMALALSGCGLGSGSTVPLRVGPGSIQPDAALEGVPITVGSKEYTEQVIMGYILEFTLAAAGADVQHRKAPRPALRHDAVEPTQHRPVGQAHAVDAFEVGERGAELRLRGGGVVHDLVRGAAPA